MASPGRVQVPEFQREAQLAPAPVVNVQPVAPVNRQGAGSSLINIAESLSALGSSFGRFAQTQRSQVAKQDAILAGDLSSMTPDQLTAHFKNNPDLLQKEKVAMMYASKQANQFGLDLQSGKLTEDWDGEQPLDQFLAQKQQEYLAGLPDDPMIRAYFNESANPYVFNYVQGRAKVEAENRVSEDIGLLKSHADNVVEQAKATTGAVNAAPGVAKRLPMITGTQPGRQPVNTKGIQGVVVDRWEQVQGVLGKQLPIVSGYRDPATNAKAGGAKNSRHLHGDAIDIDVSSLSLEERRKLIEAASAMGFTGIGVYRNSIHLDMRPNKTAWGPTHRRESVPAWAQMTINKHLGGAIPARPYSVNSAAVAVDNVFTSISETPQWKRLTPTQRTAFIYEYASAITPKTEDDLKLIEGLLTSRRSDGVPAVADDVEYAVKVRALLDKRRQEFRELNNEAQMPIRQQVADAIKSGAGLSELRRLREGSGNLLDDSFWNQAQSEMIEAERKLDGQRAARTAHNEAVDAVRSQAKLRFGVGLAFSEDAFVDVEVPDPNTPGKTTTYTAKQIKTDVKNEILNNIDKTAAENNIPDDIKWGMIANVFGKSNETISQWEGAFKATVTSSTPAQAAKDIPEQLVTNAKLYDYLKNSGNFLYLDAHLKGDNVKQFWLMYDSFRGSGQSEREALFSTYNVLNKPDAMSVAAEEVNYAEKAYFNTGGTSFVKSELNGNAEAGGKVRRMATALTATGQPAEDALATATEIFKSTHEYVQNSWVPKNLKGLPDNFKDNMEEYVGDYITLYGAKANPPVDDTEDVMIAADSSGTRFYLFQKSTGLPLMAKATKGGLSRTGVLSVTLQTLRDFDKLKNDRAAIPADKTKVMLDEAIRTPKMVPKTVSGRGAQKMVPMDPMDQVEEMKAKERQQIEKQIEDNTFAERRKAEEAYRNMTREQRINAAAAQWNITPEDAEQLLINQGLIKEK